MRAGRILAASLLNKPVIFSSSTLSLASSTFSLTVSLFLGFSTLTEKSFMMKNHLGNAFLAKPLIITLSHQKEEKEAIGSFYSALNLKSPLKISYQNFKFQFDPIEIMWQIWKVWRNSWNRFFIKTWNRLFAISLDECSFICFRKQIRPKATITEIKEKRSSFSPFFLSILIVVLLFALIRKQTWTDRYTTSCTMLLRSRKGLLMFLRCYWIKVDKAAPQKENQPIKEAPKLLKMLFAISL